VRAAKKEQALPNGKKCKYNPKDATLNDDVVSPHIGHGWDPETLPSANDMDEKNIKTGWPKHEAEYPKGYGAAMPPGCCTNACECMEDWHMGNIDQTKPWLEAREAAATAALESLLNPAMGVRRRGQVSGMHFLEMAGTSKAWDERSPALDFVKSVYNFVGEAAQALPLRALQGGANQKEKDLSQGLIATVACIYATCNPKISYTPARFRIKEGPDWLQLDAKTGCANLVSLPVADPAKQGKGVVLSIELIGLHIQPEVNEMRLQIHHERPPHGGDPFMNITRKVVRKVESLKPPLKDIVKDLMKEVYDFEKQEVLQCRAGNWAQAISNSVMAARASWYGTLAPQAE